MLTSPLGDPRLEPKRGEGWLEGGLSTESGLYPLGCGQFRPPAWVSPAAQAMRGRWGQPAPPSLVLPLSQPLWPLAPWLNKQTSGGVPPPSVFCGRESPGEGQRGGQLGGDN